MKVRKAIKRIAAIGVGATMMGATLMGALAADLSNYPNMFIKDGVFNGLLVVGENADAIDTIGVTNVALGLQKAAVTKTTVCGSATAATTTVSGEQVQIEKTGDTLNLGENLSYIDTSLDDTDLPTILANGNYDESEGNNKNSVSYTQKLTLEPDSGQIVYDQDDQDAPDAGVYLKFPKNKDIYSYNLEFDDNVEYDANSATTVSDDIESSTLEIQGQEYTITDVTTTGSTNAKTIDKLTLMVGKSVQWIEQDQTVIKEIDGVEHTVKMMDVDNGATSCGFEVDGSSIWIDVDDTKTVNGVTLGVTDAKAVYTKDYDKDTCKVFIGAAELVLENGKKIQMDGNDIDGSQVTISTTASGGDGVWTGLTITYDPSNDEYLAAGDELVDPVFGNFKFIMGGDSTVTEEIGVDASSDSATLTFTNFDEKKVEIPIAMTSGGVFNLGNDQTAVDEKYYLEGETCTGSSDVTDCTGARFIAVSTGDIVHIVELSAMDDLSNSAPEIDFDDITYDTSTNNKRYDVNATDCAYTNTNTSNDKYYHCTFSLGSSLGTITLGFNSTTNSIDAIDQVTFEDIDLGSGVIKTENEGIIAFPPAGTADKSWFTFTENNDETNNGVFNISFVKDTDGDFNVNAPSNFTAVGSGAALYGPVDKSDSNSDDQMYATRWGSILQYDDQYHTALTIWHPVVERSVDVFVAETGATTSENDATGEGCQVSTTINPIPATVNKFDTEISDPTAYDLITVGGPCANTVTSRLLGSPEVCYEGFEDGKAMLKLVESGSHVALIVAGGTGRDTKLASMILQDYDNPIYKFSGSEMEAITVSESGLKLEAKAAADTTTNTTMN